LADHERFGGRLLPLLARRGGRDIKRNIAKLPLMERTGWWFMIRNALNLIHHPVCAVSEASLFFLLAQPPLLARRGDHAVRQVCYCSPDSGGVTVG
jgi:hypothetical protein